MSSIALPLAAGLRQRARAFLVRADRGLWVVLLVGVIAVWPLLTTPSLETYTDAEMHVYRAMEVEQSIRAGNLYPRWAPDFYYGYGYPVFNYYSPLTYHLAAWYSILTFTDAAAGIKFVLVLGTLLAGLGIYLFVRDRWGGVAGVVGAAAFVYSPYMLYIDPHARGDVPEFFAIAVAPWTFWAFSRLRRSGSPGDAALGAVTLAATIFSHPLMAIAFFGMLLAWIGWEFAFGHGLIRDSGERRRRPIALAALAVALGLGLAAVLWIPAVLERGAVQLHNVAGPGYFDFRANFLSPGELFGPSLPFDYGATQPRFLFNLGVAQWFLALAGIFTIFDSRSRRPSVLFFGFAALVLIYLMLPSSVQVWEAIPPMAYFQFPSRFLGPAAFVLAVLAAAASGWSELAHARWARTSFGLAAAMACFALSLPLMYPRPWEPFGPVSVLRSLELELDGRAVGTTSGNDFLPTTADVPPGPTTTLIDSYRRDPVLDKVNRATLPAETAIIPVDHWPTGDRYEVLTDEAFVFRLFTFYFPGWKAYVNGEEVPIEVAKPEGFITFQVPAGESQVEVRFKNTPPRWLGWLFSIGSIAGVAALLTVRVRRNGQIVSPPVMPLSRGATVVLLSGFVLAGSFRGLAGYFGWFHFNSTGNQVEVAEVPFMVEFEQGINVLAYDFPVRVVSPGDEVPVTVYWKAAEPIERSYQVFIHLIGPDGQLWGQSDKLNPADFPTHRWPTDRYVRDEHVARLREDAPGGEYRVIVGMWIGATGERLIARTADGRLLGDGIQLPVRLIVTR